ncbi:hypothetical protein BDZ45DRAFT_715617 [Acephala macrosclerotiorum]|nr:hypothetical protein BDZ45DRAFT_715617 [Acephala macrosclerotiorum]
MADSSNTYEAYCYNPSLAVAITFIDLFVWTTAFHLYQMFGTRAWYYILFVVGGFVIEWIGYIGRAVSGQQSSNWTIGPFLVQTLFLLLAFVLFAASIYMELDPSGTLSAMQTGTYIIASGLFVQVLFSGFFVTVAVVFDSRIQKRPTQQYSNLSIPSQRHLKTLYVASILTMMRSMFTLYIFDEVLMLCVMVVFNVDHPSEVQALLDGGVVSKGFKMVEVSNCYNFEN